MKQIAFTFTLLLVALPAHAEIRVVQQATETIGVEDSRTYIITLVSDDPNEIIFGVDARFDGPMGQINPLGLRSPFLLDFNAIWIEEDISQDSGFLFHSSNDLSPPALGVEESDILLKAAITNLPGATNGDGLSVRLAQIAMLDSQLGTPDQVRYTFSIDVRDPSGNAVGNPTLTGLIGVVPEPATIGLLMLALAGWTGRRRR